MGLRRLAQASQFRLGWHDKTKALEGLQKRHFVLASLLTVNMYLAQDERVAQRLFIPGTSPPGAPLILPTTDVPTEGHDRWLSNQAEHGVR